MVTARPEGGPNWTYTAPGDRGDGAGSGLIQDSSTSFCRSQFNVVTPPATW
jgi:hypothetical protein